MAAILSVPRATGKSSGVEEEIADGKRPFGDGRLGGRGVAAAIDGGILRIRRAKCANAFVAQHVDVPDDERSRRKIVGALGGDSSFGHRPIVVLASHFDCEDGRALDELRAEWWSGVEGRVGSE